MKASSVRSPIARLQQLAGAAAMVAVLAAATTVASCGSSTEPGAKVTPKDTIPTTITATTTGALAGVVGTQLNTLLQVNVKNKSAQPVANALVTFAVATGGGSLSNSAVRTDSSGNASTTWTLGSTVGAQTVTATVGTLAPITFSATATAGAVANLAKVAGDAQTAVAGANVATAPSVKVTDKFGNPLANVPVTFTASTGSTVTNPLPSTDANGVAAVGTWKLSTTPGANTLTATVAGVSTPVTFTATGVVGPVSRVTITSPAIPTLQVGQTGTVTAAAFDANNNPVTNPAFTYSSSNTAVATVSNAGVVTAVGTGTATITVTSNGVSATTSVTVIGHPGVTVASTISIAGRPRRIATTNGNVVYTQSSTGGSVVAVDAATGTVLWADTLGGNVVDVAVNAANTVVTAASTGAAGTPMLYLINPATHKTTDSVALSANPVKMVMNSLGTRAFVDENTFQVETIDLVSKSVVSQTPLAGTLTSMKMTPGDQSFFASTTLGSLFEVDASTGAIKRQFNPSTTITDLDIAPDGKTLFVADGSSSVTMIRLATGGLSGSVDFGVNITGVGITPDQKQLWATSGTTVIAAPSDNAGSFQTNLVQGRTSVTGANFSRIGFLPNGTAAVVIDDAGLNLVIFK